VCVSASHMENSVTKACLAASCNVSASFHCSASTLRRSAQRSGGLPHFLPRWVLQCRGRLRPLTHHWKPRRTDVNDRTMMRPEKTLSRMSPTSFSRPIDIVLSFSLARRCRRRRCCCWVHGTNLRFVLVAHALCSVIALLGDFPLTDDLIQSTAALLCGGA